MEEAVRWKKLFVEIATRAIRKAHFKFQIVTQGQSGLHTKSLLELNSGEGVELAPEESVRNEIINQTLTLGIWKKTKFDDAYRSYWCDREANFRIDKQDIVLINAIKTIHPKLFAALEHFVGCADHSTVTNRNKIKNFNIDITLRRFEEGEKFAPCLIELKRLSTKRFDLGNLDHPVKDGNSREAQLEEIRKDIKKLRVLRECMMNGVVKNEKEERSEDQNAILCILTWGIIASSETDFESTIINDLGLSKEDKAYSEFRYFPIEWDTKKISAVTKWCVIALIEIDSCHYKVAERC